MVNKNEFRSNLLRMSQMMLNKQHHVGGAPAEEANNILISQFYAAWIYLSSDVTTRLDISMQSIEKRILNFVQALDQMDVLDVLTICQDACELLLDSSISDYSTFKASIETQHPGQENLLGRLLSPISLFLVSYYDATNEVKADSLKNCFLFLKFGKKLNLKALGLEEQSLSLYLACEDRLSAVCLDEVPELITGMNSIMKCWLRDFNCQNLIPRHGSGSVAEGKLSYYDKFLNLGVDTYLKVVLGNYYRDYYPMNPANEIVRVSRTVFVPKTFSKLRTISMEPCSLMYIQQGVMHKLYSFIKHHPYLGERIKLEDQTQNRDLAREGSLHNNFSTIDLSAASDSVSWSLVKRIFNKTPLMKWLIATRSKQTLLPNGKVIALKKFAPMGSALCFPIECLIFACVVEYVSQKWCKQGGWTRSRYSIYGDDIIVDTTITSDVILALESLGFIVNRSKSFTTGPFRESCGGDYFDGIDVSSVYYRIDAFNKRKLSPEVYSALCSLANMAEDKGLHELRHYIIKIILPMGPYFTDTTMTSPALYSKYPTNFKARKKYDEDLQCWLGRFVTVISKQNSSPQGIDSGMESQCAYFLKLAEMALKGPSAPSVFDEATVGVSLHGSYVTFGHMRREVPPESNQVVEIDE